MMPNQFERIVFRCVDCGGEIVTEQVKGREDPAQYKRCHRCAATTWYLWQSRRWLERVRAHVEQLEQQLLPRHTEDNQCQ